MRAESAQTLPPDRRQNKIVLGDGTYRNERARSAGDYHLIESLPRRPRRVNGRKSRPGSVCHLSLERAAPAKPTLSCAEWRRDPCPDSSCQRSEPGCPFSIGRGAFWRLLNSTGMVLRLGPIAQPPFAQGGRWSVVQATIHANQGKRGCHAFHAVDPHVSDLWQGS